MGIDYYFFLEMKEEKHVSMAGWPLEYKVALFVLSKKSDRGLGKLHIC